MTHINLLPWREQKREQEKKRFATLLFGCVLIAVVIVCLINYHASSLVNNQIVRNQMLQKELSIIDKQLKEIKNLEKVRETLISRMSIVHYLQSRRTLMVHLFDELINIMPSGVYLTKIEGKDDIISVTGYAKSNTYISILMKNIENNEWLHHSVLNEIKRQNTQQLANNEFKLTFVLEPPFQIGVIQ